MWIDDEAALKALYGAVGEASIAKEVPHLTPAYRALVEASPFCVLATAVPRGSTRRRAAIRPASSASSMSGRC